MSAVLATLQPDQYRAVTQAADDTWIIHGHPGTGKTVIGTHRAAYLVDDNRESERPIHSVLYVCPTDVHAKHVRGVLATLDRENRVIAKSLDQLWEDVSGVRLNAVGQNEDFYDTASETCRTIRELEHQIVSLIDGRRPSRQLQAAYEFMCKAELPNPDLSSWQATLPGWKTARQLSRFRPLLAYLSLTLDPMRSIEFQHIIVDEAQDVRPMEWELLSLFRERTSTTWTLLGDMDQRRTHHSQSSWERVKEHLRSAGAVGEVREQALLRGYRSTEAILQFAGQLLPRGRRPALTSVQAHGELPTIHRAADKKALAADAVEVAAGLCQKRPNGTTAIIAAGTDTLIGELRRREWTATSRNTWTGPDGVSISVLMPESARGVEFDHVVVVEPADFTPLVNGPGLLYTSLTRANRELAVVHSNPLPRLLRSSKSLSHMM